METAILVGFIMLLIWRPRWVLYIALGWGGCFLLLTSSIPVEWKAALVVIINLGGLWFMLRATVRWVRRERAVAAAPRI